MSTKEKIRELLDEGLAPKEIAEKTGVKTQTVYTYRHMFKKEDEPLPKKKTKETPDTKSDKRIKKLEQINKNHLNMLEEKNEKIDELSQLLENAESKVESLKKAYDELDDDLLKLQDELDTSKNEFDTAVKLSTEEKEQYELDEQLLTNENDKLRELLYRREQRIKEMQQELGAEQEKHNHLSNYARLLMKEGVANA